MKLRQDIVAVLIASALLFCGIGSSVRDAIAANPSIDQLSNAAALSGTDYLPVTQGGSPVIAKRSTMSAVATYITISQAALPTTLTGLTITNSPITSADTILSGLGKAQGQINALVTGVSSVFGRTGAVIAVSGDYTAAQVTNAADKSSVTKQSFTAGLSGVDFTATGITGAVSTTRYAGGTTSGAPVAGTFSVGDYVVTLDGSMWIATASGTPGTWVAVGSRNNLVPSVFGRTGAIVATSGDYSTNLVTENTNLYFTDARVRATALTGLSITNSAITSADTVLSAFGKAQGQINAMVSGVSSVFGRTGAVVAATGDYTQNQITNLTTTSSPTFANVTATSRVTGTAGWIAGLFGGSGTDKVVAGYLTGYATIAGANNALSAYVPIILQPDAGANLGIGLLTASQAPNARLHSSGSTILGVATSAVSDANIYNSQTNIWFDETNTRLNFKTKSSAGAVTSFLMKESARQRVSTTVDTNSPTDDIVALDSTSGSNLFVIDRANLKWPIIITWSAGVSLPQFQAASGQTIDGLSTAITMNTLGTTVMIVPIPGNATGMVIVSVRGSIT